jgi:hypothetical protein
MGSTSGPVTIEIALDQPQGERGHRQRSLPQSSSASRRTASQAGFFILTQFRDSFETMLSSPSLQGTPRSGCAAEKRRAYA